MRASGSRASVVRAIDMSGVMPEPPPRRTSSRAPSGTTKLPDGPSTSTTSPTAAVSLIAFDTAPPSTRFTVTAMRDGSSAELDPEYARFSNRVAPGRERGGQVIVKNWPAANASSLPNGSAKTSVTAFFVSRWTSTSWSRRPVTTDVGVSFAFARVVNGSMRVPRSPFQIIPMSRRSCSGRRRFVRRSNIEGRA